MLAHPAQQVLPHGFHLALLGHAQRVVQLTRHSAQYTPVGHVVDERAVVNGIVGLLSKSGGVTGLLKKFKGGDKA